MSRQNSNICSCSLYFKLDYPRHCSGNWLCTIFQLFDVNLYLCLSVVILVNSTTTRLIYSSDYLEHVFGLHFMLCCLLKSISQCHICVVKLISLLPFLITQCLHCILVGLALDVVD